MATDTEDVKRKATTKYPERKKSRKKKTHIKIFFDRFSNLEIIFFSLPLLRTRRTYLSINLSVIIIIIIIWYTMARFVSSASIIADSVYLSSGVPGAR